jgi:RAB protein geranylgeranyltransferase component A
MPQPLEVTEYDVIILGTGFVESILAGYAIFFTIYVVFVVTLRETK